MDIDSTGTGMRTPESPRWAEAAATDVISRLDSQVELFAQGIAKALGQIDGTHRSAPAPIETSGETFEDGEI